MKLIAEETFEKGMQETVEPRLASLCKKGHFGDGLYYEAFYPPDRKGTVVISHGFTECSLKFHEVAYYFVEAGYGAALIDHRGHGFSPRMTEDPNVVHIDSFNRYVEDFHTFLETVVKPDADGKPLYLYGHSMGGCISALVLETYPGVFKKAILNAPMLGIQTGNIPWWAAVLICKGMQWSGKGKEKLFYHDNFNPTPKFEDDCATSRARFDYYQALRCQDKALQTSAASYCWAKESVLAGRRAVKNAGRVQTPVLLFQAGLDTLVDAKAQEKFVEKAPKAKLIRFPDAKHEIYRSENSLLTDYWGKIFEFFGK